MSFWSRLCETKLLPKSSRKCTLRHIYVIPMVLNNYIHVSEVDKGFEGIRVNIPDERPIPDVSEESVDEVVSALNSTASKEESSTPIVTFTQIKKGYTKVSLWI